MIRLLVIFCEITSEDMLHVLQTILCILELNIIQHQCDLKKLLINRICETIEPTC